MCSIFITMFPITIYHKASILASRVTTYKKIKWHSLLLYQKPFLVPLLVTRNWKCTSSDRKCEMPIWGNLLWTTSFWPQKIFSEVFVQFLSICGNFIVGTLCFASLLNWSRFPVSLLVQTNKKVISSYMYFINSEFNSSMRKKHTIIMYCVVRVDTLTWHQLCD